MPVRTTIDSRDRAGRRDARADGLHIVLAADEERRRIERDLHDGAQQRIVALALRLRSAQRRLGGGAGPEIDRLLAAAVHELELAVAELRDLARGIHPATLTEEGLAAALESIATTSPLAVSLDVCPERLPAPVESTAYFVVCEALANAAKHGHASEVSVCARLGGGSLLVVVADDGVGGARPGGGSGLLGLAERVGALGGRLEVESDAEAGTRIVAEIPCEP
jgi:signal transduction histidine kinase